MKYSAQLIIDRIESAFADVHLEDGVSLHEARVIDRYGSDVERKQARAHDEQIDWKRIRDELIAASCSSLSFFDPKGMRFHLPAFMKFALRHYEDPDSCSIDWTIYALGYDDHRYSLLTRAQEAAVQDFLTFMAFHAEGGVDSREAKRVLEEIWLKENSPVQPDVLGGDC